MSRIADPRLPAPDMQASLTAAWRCFYTKAKLHKARLRSAKNAPSWIPLLHLFKELRYFSLMRAGSPKSADGFSHIAYCKSREPKVLSVCTLTMDSCPLHNVYSLRCKVIHQRRTAVPKRNYHTSDGLLR